MIEADVDCGLDNVNQKAPRPKCYWRLVEEVFQGQVVYKDNISASNELYNPQDRDPDYHNLIAACEAFVHANFP